MAEGKEIKGAQRGIAFSTGSALIVSILILIVGSGAGEAIDGAFKIGQLSGVIREQLGEAGVVVFALGFIAAALSSMLTVPLGAALTADSVFSSAPEARAEAIGTDNPNFADDEGRRRRKPPAWRWIWGRRGRVSGCRAGSTSASCLSWSPSPLWSSAPTVSSRQPLAETIQLFLLQRTADSSFSSLKSSTAASSPSSPSVS